MMSDRLLTIIPQPASLDDIQRQGLYFRREAGAETARRFLDGVYSSMDDLALMPGMGTLVGNRILPDLRRWPVKGFPKILIFYRYTENSIYIVRVLHRARDLEPILNDEWEMRE